MINRKLKTIYNQETKDNKDELENLVDKKHKNLISLQNSKFALKQQNEVFNMTKEFYNVKTHCGS